MDRHGPTAASLRSALAIAVGVSMGSAAACTSFGSVSDEPAPAGASDDGGSPAAVDVPDASPNDVAPSDGSGGPFPVVDTFADGCGLWRPALPSSVTPVAVEGGGRACRMCFDAASTGYVARTYLDIKEPGRYSFQAQVMPDGRSDWVVALIVYLKSGGERRSDSVGSFGAGSGGWTTIAVPQLTVSEPVDDARVQFAVQGECLLVRDARLIKE